ncbi:MAG: hypothetical protein M3O70_28655 [Actinomycetota bacterium]|nr:hypothetical protein [Actinomycetota bacterium]
MSTGGYVSPLTCSVDGLAHLVSEDALAAGLSAASGLYVARCGHQVAAAPLVSPPGPPCPRCTPERRSRLRWHTAAPPERPVRGGWAPVRLRRGRG